MKIEITETPKVTYSKMSYMFRAKIEDQEYKICRVEDDNGAEVFIEPFPEKDEVYDSIENLFFHDNFHYNTTQAGETLEVED